MSGRSLIVSIVALGSGFALGALSGTWSPEMRVLGTVILTTAVVTTGLVFVHRGRPGPSRWRNLR